MLHQCNALTFICIALREIAAKMDATLDMDVPRITSEWVSELAIGNYEDRDSAASFESSLAQLELIPDANLF